MITDEATTKTFRNSSVLVIRIYQTAFCAKRVLLNTLCALFVLATCDAFASPVDRCDQLSAHPADPDRRALGKGIEDIPLPEAINVCKDAVEIAPDNLRIVYQYGRSLWAGGSQVEGEGWIHKAADSGYAQAIYYLGVLEEERDSPKFTVAADYYHAAASLGHPMSMTKLGGMYSNGKGVALDAVASLFYYKQAAELGDEEAQFWTGYIYYSGLGVITDYFEAARWFTKATEQHEPLALYYLGRMYLNGEGVKKDEAKAFELIKKSADQDIELAFALLGYCYAKGLGTSADIKEAIKWLRMAVEEKYLPAFVTLAWVLVGLNDKGSVEEGLVLLKSAAELGYYDAADYLASTYYYGWGVPEDNQKASFWKDEAERLMKLQGERPMNQLPHRQLRTQPYG